MKIVVCLKPVPDTNTTARIDPQTKRLIRLANEAVINPLDEFALEAALRIRETNADTTVTVLAMAPESARETLRKALAIGADDAVLVSSERLAGSDGRKSARVLVAALRTIGFDVVLCGTQSSDGTGGYLPTMIAELLGVAVLPNVRKTSVIDGRAIAERNVDGVVSELRASLPLVISVSKESAAPRYASLKGIMGAKRKEIRVLSDADLAGLDALPVLTRVVDIAAPPARTRGRVVDASDAKAGAEAAIAFLRERALL